MIIPVILSGGSGTRLWPLSRELHPKQFLPLCSDNTMIQDTVVRLSGIKEMAKPIVVCNESHRFLVAEQMRQIEVDLCTIVLEPFGRNTAPAIAAAAFRALEISKNAILLVLPADHVIKDVATFQASIEAGKASAAKGKLVTFGIIPNNPETGYGYIKSSGRAKAGEMKELKVEAFVEKPDFATAEKYVKDGKYYWNSGMFMFSAAKYLKELKKYQPEVLKCSEQSYKSSSADEDFLRLGKEAFEKCPSISIDYAVMEKTSSAVVFPVDIGWNDVGSWSALSDVNAHDDHGNVVTGDVLLKDVENCLVRANSRLVTAVGVSDHVIVETADSVLVVSKDRVQDVKSIVDKLKKSDRYEAIHHRRVSRPWGFFQTIDISERFHAKRITVKPGARLSLQMHFHRAEHWIVVSGTAKITKGEETFVMTENQSTYIPLGTKHRLENPGKIPLEIIEVQSGSYLREDDIVRFDDQYGRE